MHKNTHSMKSISSVSEVSAGAAEQTATQMTTKN